ncbi:MAG: DUF938 domain-containing protein [Pseudomonadales bacterium]|nr:DUF938 domain-containing protein [Pseudomonadales bacterium]
MHTLPFSAACERNQTPILEQITPWLSGSRHVLEIASGTGQHAVHFANALPQLSWQTSDLSSNILGIQRRLDAYQLPNTPPCMPLDALATAWPKAIQEQNFDAIFTANSLHIMSQDAVAQLFQHLGLLARPEQQLIIYGPFNIAGEYTAASNAAFDQQLQQHDPASGIRELEWIIDLASKQAFTYIEAIAMPANNLLLHFVCKT